MKLTIYKSRYGWQETINQLAVMDNVSQNIQVGTYYKLESFEIEQKDSFHDDDLTKLTVLPIAKKKKREKTAKQQVLDSFINQHNDRYADFSPENGDNLDTILVVKQTPKNYKNVYLIPFGQGFREVEKVADPNFGIDFAEREIRETDIITKHVNYFGQDKSQAITNYRRTSRDVALPSEAYVSITAYPERKDLYGSTIVCALGVTLLVKNTSKISFEKSLCEVVRNVDELMQGNTRLSKFPRIQFVNTSDQIEALDKRLTNIIKSRKTAPETKQVRIPDSLGNKITIGFEQSINLLFLANIANSIIFLDEMTNIWMFFQGIKKEKVEVDQSGHSSILSQIGRMLHKYPTKHLKDMMFECNDNSGETFDYSVQSFISAEITNKKVPYVLQNGRWGTFNSEFFELINDSLTDIEVECNETNFLVDIGTKKVDGVRDGSEEDYMNALLDNNDENFEKIHKYFAKPSSNNFVYRGPGVELADMYFNPAKELLTMKNGESTAMTMYSLEQSILALSVINNRNSYDTSDIANALGGVEKLNEIMAARKNGLVWIFPIKESDNKARFESTRTQKIQNNTVDLKSMGSILVKVKLSEWAQCVREAHQSPLIHFVTPLDFSR